MGVCRILIKITYLRNYLLIIIVIIITIVVVMS